MEPKLPSPERGHEPHLISPETSQESLGRSPETEVGLSRGVERPEPRREDTPQPPRADNTVTVLPAPTVPVADDTSSSTPAVQDDNPATANDADQIEKEWVDKAKKVIAETKDDPYRREQEVSKLQADYLFKRYGRKLGSPQ